MFKHNYRCASIKGNIWYEFKNHRWQPIDSGTTIFTMLNDEYPQKYKKVADYYYYRSQQYQNMCEPNDTRLTRERINLIDNCSKSLEGNMIPYSSELLN